MTKDKDVSHPTTGLVDVAVSPCLFNKNPPLSTDTNSTNNPHTFATALDGVTMPIAMHNALAHTFVNTTTTVNHTRHHTVAIGSSTPPACKPTIGYVISVKNTGGNTRRMNMSKHTMLVK